jgi:hypothetical protein
MDGGDDLAGFGSAWSALQQQSGSGLALCGPLMDPVSNRCQAIFIGNNLGKTTSKEVACTIPAR